MSLPQTVTIGAFAVALAVCAAVIGVLEQMRLRVNARLPEGRAFAGFAPIEYVAVVGEYRRLYPRGILWHVLFGLGGFYLALFGIVVYFGLVRSH